MNRNYYGLTQRLTNLKPGDPLKVAKSVFEASVGTISTLAAETCGANHVTNVRKLRVFKSLYRLKRTIPDDGGFYSSGYYPSTLRQIQLQLKFVKQLANLFEDSLAKNDLKVAIPISQTCKLCWFRRAMKSLENLVFFSGKTRCKTYWRL